MDEEAHDKEEFQKLRAQFLRTPKTRSRLGLLCLRMGVGYAAMALFSAAALLYSSVTLYQINKATRQRIATTDIPVLTALIKMRAALLAQEDFAGKYAIFKDPTFAQLFRQRNDDAVANLAVLEGSRSIRNLDGLKKLYLDYQRAAERLLTGGAPFPAKRQASALLLLTTLDELYLERQGTLQTILERADEEQRKTIRWGIGISCAGFLLAVLLARVTIYRLIRALGILQDDTRRVAAGDYDHHPLVPALKEVGELTSDINQIASRVIELEQLELDVRRLTRLPGNQAIERALDLRLQSGVPFSFCRIELHNFQRYLAHHGYAKAGELLYQTGVLIYKAVRRLGETESFAGHAGGDCFVMVVPPEWEGFICEAVSKDFAAELGKHLSPEERDAGGSRGDQRDGGGRFSSIPSLSIAVLACDNRAYASSVEIARAAAAAKDTLQKRAGSGSEELVDQPGR